MITQWVTRFRRTMQVHDPAYAPLRILILPSWPWLLGQEQLGGLRLVLSHLSDPHRRSVPTRNAKAVFRKPRLPAGVSFPLARF
jgi:hypothetical protein